RPGGRAPPLRRRAAARHQPGRRAPRVGPVPLARDRRRARRAGSELARTDPPDRNLLPRAVAARGGRPLRDRQRRLSRAPGSGVRAARAPAARRALALVLLVGPAAVDPAVARLARRAVVDVDEAGARVDADA